MQTAFNPGSVHNILTPLHFHNALSHSDAQVTHEVHHAHMQSSMQKTRRITYAHRCTESTAHKLTHMLSPQYAN